MKKDEQVIIDDFEENDKIENESLIFWDYKSQNEIVGVVEVFENGNYGGHKIGLKTNSEELIFIPELTALNSKLSNLEIGNKIKIVYKGEEKSKKSGRMYMTFDVYIK